MTTRAEHLAWCKERALEYVERGNLPDAMTSMVSDLGKHPETQGHMGIMLGAAMMSGGLLATADQMKKFIEDFN